MAVRTVSNTGGNWNATTTWVGGVVPIAGDTVDFTATSGNLVVNVATVVLAGINFTNYANTITFTAAITSTGTINLGNNGFTQAGASGLIVSGTATISGTTVWSRTLQFTGTSITYTLGSNLTVTGAISLSGTTASTFIGNTLNIGGSLTVSNTVTISGTTTFNFNGTGTWNHTAAGVIQNNVTINTSGTLTIGTNIYYNTGTLTYTAGTVTTTGSTLNISASTTLDTDRGATQIDWNNVITSATPTITLSSNLNIANLTLTSSSTLSFVSGGNILSVSNNLTTGIQATFNTPNNLQVTNLILGTGGNGNININGLFTISVSGNLTQNHGSLITTGTTNITLNGTGTWSNPATGVLRNNLTIDTLGTLTVSGNVYYNTGTLTYIAGTVVSTGSVLNITSSTTINTSGMTWRDISITAGTQTLTSDLNSEVLRMNNAGTVNVDNSGGNVYILESLIKSGVGISQGTASINLIGTGTWTHTAVGVIRNNININTTGTLTIGTNVYYAIGTLTYLSGKINAKNSTFNISSNATLINCHKINFDNIRVNQTSIVTMNEFFSGSPSLVTNIVSNGSNYTIAFQDGFEKIAKFVDIASCTLSKPLQLLVLTKSKKSPTNIGIRYINQSPNGIAKGEPSVNLTTFGAGGLLPDPTNL